MGKLNQDQRRQMMLRDPIPLVVTKMAIPTIVAFLINAVYSLADTYFVSSLGTNATAAVSVNASLDQLIMMTSSLLAVGANSFIARLLGQNNEKKASQVLSTAFFLAIGIGLLFMIMGISFMEPMVNLLGATDTCRQYSIDYAAYVLYAAPFMTASFVMNQCLRSEGSAVFSMVGMGFGGVLNCFLDPIFIFDLNMGVAGASLATAISKVVSFAILIVPYLFKRSVLHLSIRNVRFRREIFKEIISVGSSSMFRSGLAVVTGILLNNIAGHISDSLLAGIGVSTKIMNFPFFIILGFCNGFQPVAGYNWGAKRYDRVMESYRFSSMVSVLGAAVMAVLLIVFVDPIIVLFSGTDPEMRKYGAICIVSQCIALPIHSWVATVNMLCAGLGNGKGAFLLATARQGSCMLLLFPLLLLLLSYGFGYYAISTVQAGADLLSLALALPIHIYMTKKIRAASKQQPLTV